MSSRSTCREAALDAHTLIWAVDNPAKLGPIATSVLQDPTNDLLLSSGTIWEISIKAELGKLSLSLPFRQWMDQAIHDLLRSWSQGFFADTNEASAVSSWRYYTSFPRTRESMGFGFPRSQE